MAAPDHAHVLLIVHDDDAARRRFARQLMLQPLFACEIVQARDGVAGLAALRGRTPDCVLLQYSLPDMTALEFLARAAGDGDPPCAVVLITGPGEEVAATEAMVRGVRDFLDKSEANETRLWRAIASAMAHRDRRPRRGGAPRAARAAPATRSRETEAELRAARDAAESANQAKTRFVAMLSHELRAPLQCILGYAELLGMQATLTAPQTRHVAAMARAGRHLLEMIDRVRDFASIEAGRMEVRAVAVAVRGLTDDCVAVIGPMAALQDLDLRVVRSAGAPETMIADQGCVRQILLNLLGIALKHTGRGEVELCVLPGAVPGGIRFEIAAAGAPVDPALRERLSRNLERLGAGEAADGAGLALAIAARVAGLIDATIGHTANQGGGSVFWLEVPPGDEAARQEENAAAPPALACKRLLVVDDIAVNRDVIGAFLHAAGHEVTLAESGEEAIRLAFEQHFDLILMDVRMPDMDGLEATRRIRALPAPRGEVPILGVTAHAFLDQVAECRAAGMDGHVAKPVAYATLMGAIGTAIARVPARWQAESPKAGAAQKAPAADPPRGLDRAVLDETLSFLRPDEIGTHLQTLRSRKEELVRLLDMPTDPALLTETAHGLASVAGMFGFTFLSVLARRFEHAMAHDAPEAEELGRRLRTETRSAIAVLDILRREFQMQAA